MQKLDNGRRTKCLSGKKQVLITVILPACLFTHQLVSLLQLVLFWFPQTVKTQKVFLTVLQYLSQKCLDCHCSRIRKEGKKCNTESFAIRQLTPIWTDNVFLPTKDIFEYLLKILEKGTAYFHPFDKHTTEKSLSLSLSGQVFFTILNLLIEAE